VSKIDTFSTSRRSKKLDDAAFVLVDTSGR